MPHPGLLVALGGYFGLSSEIIHGGETNYIFATVPLYVAIFNLFTSVLQLLGFMSGDG